MRHGPHGPSSVDQSRRPSGAVALLELLARAAPARVVAAELLALRTRPRPAAVATAPPPLPTDVDAPDAAAAAARAACGSDRLGARERLVLVAQVAVAGPSRPSARAVDLLPRLGRQLARGRASGRPPRGSCCAELLEHHVALVRGTRRADPSAPSRAGGCPRAGSPCSRGARASGGRRSGGSRTARRRA